MTASHAHLSTGQRDLLTRCEALARDVLEPSARGGEPGRVNRPLIASLSEHGLLPLVLQRDHEIPAFELCLIREGLARFSTEAETAFAVQCLGAHPILAAGRPTVIDTWMPRVIAGAAVTAFALTEPRGGTDVGSLELVWSEVVVPLEVEAVGVVVWGSIPGK
jgi:alkylation response protein AidB-like acyl-CoA dehydrogenase